MRGDDAVGVAIINRLSRNEQSSDSFLNDEGNESALQNRIVEKTDAHSRFRFINGGSAPENVLGEIKTFRPDALVFIDAVVSNRPAGTVSFIDTGNEKISGISFCTHSLPLTIIANYLRQTVPCEIFVIGIEPEDLNFRADCVLTESVACAADEIVDAISEHTTGIRCR